jgi:hypothetical protein
MKKLAELLPIFGIAFALIYAPTMDRNWALATYQPKQGIWQFGVHPGLEGGPAMYWYGFVMTAFLGALAVTIIAALIPERMLARVPWPSLAWILPICSVLYMGYVLLPYATK